jgi:serine/threonine protein kinase
MIGRYEQLRRLREGGMAVVHLARQVDLQRLVALKELRGLHAEDPAYAQRFLREARLAGSINDPNVVSVYEYLEHDGTPYLAME